jgi:hypothetical protein
MVTIHLTEDQVADARRMAQITYEHWENHPGYYGNSLDKHRKARLSEIAVEAWLRSADLEPDAAYRDPEREREPDLLLGASGIAVKCWDISGWDTWGRCVTPGQLPHIKANARAVIWCVVNEVDPRRPVVEIAGWSTPEDIQREPITMTGPSYRKVANHQVAIESLREPEDLLDYL